MCAFHTSTAIHGPQMSGAVARNEVIVRTMGATEGFSLCELELPGAPQMANGRHGGSKVVEEQ